MADFIKQGIDFLQTVRTEVNSQLVTIKRGANTTENVPARIAGDREVADQFGTRVSGSDRDFVIKATDYVIDGSVVEPEDDDIIVDVSSGTAVEYEVRPMEDLDSASWSDNYGVAWRIHTVRVLNDQ